jgi:S1-C subfamily serine protease
MILRTLSLLGFIAVLCWALAPAHAENDPHPLDAMGRLTADMYEKIQPSVVGIRVERDLSDPNDPDRRRQTRNRTQEDFQNRPEGWTTGTIIGEDGWILTSWFNVRGSVTKIEVWLPGGEIKEAQLVARDDLGDAALLKVEAEGLTALELCDDLSFLRKGHFAFVVGRSPDPKRPTINTGIISALGRFKGTCLQTDAEVNYANAGGPLVDLDGRLVGIISHINTRGAWGQSSGVGFATRADRIAKHLPKMKEGEDIPEPPQPWMGITPVQGAVGVQGITVDSVVENSPADKAEIQKNDIIIAINEKETLNLRALQSELARFKVGDVIKVKLTRGEQTLTLDLTLEERP